MVGTAAEAIVVVAEVIVAEAEVIAAASASRRRYLLVHQSSRL